MKRQKSILIVDDEIDLGEVIVDILSPLYQEVIFQNSPELARKLVESREFSLIITDVNMPKLAGPDLVRCVRAAGHLNPILFLTGFSSKELVLSALRLGATDVLEKPFQETHLVQTIDRIFDLEKRKMQLSEDQVKKETSPEGLVKQRKMIGLLQVANDKKKTGS